MKGFGARLREAREKRKLSQLELADMVGIHLSQLGRVERGLSVPSSETVLALSRALRTSTDALLRGDRNDEPPLEIENIRLFERVRALQSLGRDEQETAIKVIDALIAKHRVREAVAS